MKSQAASESLAEVEDFMIHHQKHRLFLQATNKLTTSEDVEVVAEPDPQSDNEINGGDVRSDVAMEELASLMLTVKLEDQGEPSFIISTGKAISTAQANLTFASESLRTWTETTIDWKSLRQQQRQMVKTFMERFNSFHRILDSAEASIVGDHDVDTGSLDLKFRNSTLFAVAAYLSDDVNISELSALYAQAAEEICLKCIRECPSDLIVQGLSLLSWRDLQLGKDSMAYNYIGSCYSF